MEETSGGATEAKQMLHQQGGQTKAHGWQTHGGTGAKVRKFPKSVLFIPQAEVEYFLPTYLIFVEIFKRWDRVETHCNLVVYGGFLKPQCGHYRQKLAYSRIKTLPRSLHQVPSQTKTLRMLFDDWASGFHQVCLSLPSSVVFRRVLPCLCTSRLSSYGGIIFHKRKQSSYLAANTGIHGVYKKIKNKKKHLSQVEITDFLLRCVVTTALWMCTHYTTWAERRSVLRPALSVYSTPSRYSSDQLLVSDVFTMRW